MIHSTSTHHHLSRTIATYAALAFLVASATWLAILVRAALELRSRVPGSSVLVSFGPLHLHTLSKLPHGESYTVTLSVMPHTLWFWGGWILLGLVVGFVRARKRIRSYQE